MATEFELRITELYTEGKPITLIAQRFSVEPREVISMLKRLRVYDASREEKGGGAGRGPKREQPQASRPAAVSRPKERQPRASSSADVLISNEDMLSSRIVALHNQGRMPDEIAKIVGRQRHMVIYTLHKAGLQLQPKEIVCNQKVEEKQVEAVEPAVEPTAEPAVQPIVEPVAEPVVEPIMGPVAEPAVGPVVESAPAPVCKVRKKKAGRWSEEVMQAVVQVARESLYPNEPEDKIKAMVEALNRRPCP
jgi:hypothetical protein